MTTTPNTETLAALDRAIRHLMLAAWSEGDEDARAAAVLQALRDGLPVIEGVIAEMRRYHEHHWANELSRAIGNLK